MYDVTVIGPAVIDVLAAPYDADAFSRGADFSRYMDGIRMSYGGDALNESTVLTRLGKKVQLISRIGEDEAGRSILGHLKNNGISTESISVQEGLDTSVNIALIAGDGSRKFLMNRNSSLRSLGPDDVLPYFRRSSGAQFSCGQASVGQSSPGQASVGQSSPGQAPFKQDPHAQIPGQPVRRDTAEIVSFASMFISPLFTIDGMKELFAAVKAAGKTLVVDMTRPKNGETIDDLRELLPYIDVFVPNDEEISALTGEQDPEKNARLLVEAGVGTAVVKTGGDGCFIGTGWSFTGCSFTGAETKMRGGNRAVQILHVPAVPGIRCVDTTGAGDTFAAGFIAGLCNGWGAAECARLGCAAASCSIEQIGATDGVRTLEQVMERYAMLL